MSQNAVISLVESDRPTRKIVTRSLSRAGWTIRAFASGEAFLDAYDPTIPGCVVLDERLPGLSGLTTQRRLTARAPHAAIVFITGSGDVSTAVKAMQSGAISCLAQPFTEQELRSTIAQALERDAEARYDEAQCAEIRHRVGLLTPREREVINLVLSGHLNKQIASELGLSQRTVEVHRHHAMKKMEADSVVDLFKMMLDILQ